MILNGGSNNSPTHPLKRILLIVAATFAFIILLICLLSFLYRDKVKQMVVQSLNDHLTAKIEVADISFSFLRAFPYASVEFVNIKAGEAKGFISTGTVLNAARLSLQLNPLSIFKDEYRLKKIVLENATLNLQVDENGVANYRIWKSNGNDSGMQIGLEQVEFKNVNVLYYDVARQHDISMLIEEGTLQGNFNNDNYHLATEGNLKNASVIIEKVRYLSGKDCKVQLGLDVDRIKGTYTFRNSLLHLAGLKLAVDGSITSYPEYMDLDLAIRSPEADLPSLLSLIPEKYNSGQNEYNYSGEITFEGSIKGKSGVKHTPLVEFTFTSKDAYLNPKNTPYKLKQLNGKGFFTNRKNKANPVTFLKLENMTASLEGKPVKATIEIENFNHPRLNVDASLEVDLKALSKFFKPDTLEDISGTAFVDAEFNGIADEKSTYRSSGNIRFSNVSFHVKNNPVAFTRFNGSMHLRGNDLLVETLNGNAGSSDFNLKGTFRNLFAWLFSENQALWVDASLSSGLIRLDELLEREGAHNDTTYRLVFSDKLKLQLEIDVVDLRFRKFQSTDIRGSVSLANRLLETRNLTFKSVDGSVQLAGSVDDRDIDSLKINCVANINQLDINKLFYEMGNFGQQVIMDKNLKGIITATVDFRSKWSNKLEINSNSVLLKSDIKIENGELINLQSLMALSKYLKAADFKTVKFSTLTNTIEIKNRVVYVPSMEIHSSAADITVNGKHSFDNMVDYKLQLYLSQLMGRKIKQQHTEFGTIEDDGLGRPMLYLSMKGPGGDPKFTWDRQGVEQKITREIQAESQTFKNILKQEFGKKNTAASTVEKPKNQEELEVEYEEDSEP